MLTWDGQIARTYYSSSSGGRTVAVQDAWHSAPIPYLRSVPDPYDTYSPHHNWGPYNFSSTRLAGQLGLGSAIESAQVQRDSSLRAQSVVFRLASGAVVRRSAAGVARSLHLLSTWFSIGQLQLSVSSSHVLYGSRITLAARAANVQDAVLQQRTPTGAWMALRRVRSPARLTFQPRASTAFRLVAPGTNGTSVPVAVTPRVQVRALSPRVLAGEVSPRPDAAVAVWRLVSGRWRVVAHPILDATRQLQDAVAAPPRRVQGHGRRRQAGGYADVAPPDAADAPEPG